jgi:hypothetical protein
MKTLLLAVAMILANIFDSVAQWTKINSVSSRPVVVLAQYGDTILAASDMNFLFRSIDDGVLWTPITLSSGNIAITTLDVIDGIIYVGTSADGIFYSINGGLSWMKKGNNLSAVSAIQKRGNDLYAATLGEGVFLFDQDTDRWIGFNNSLPTYSVNVFTMVSTPESLLIGAGANGTYYRYDFANSQWNEGYYYGLLRPGLIINRLIAVSNTIFAVNGYRIIRSDDEGLSWEDDRTGSHAGISRNIYCGADNIYTITNMLNGGTWIQGRSKSSLSGSSWAETEDFLQGGFSYDIIEYRNKLFLARADGIYVKDGILGTDKSLPDNSDIELFPNPSDGKLINISSDMQINKLTILNILGQIEYSEIVRNNTLIISSDLKEGVYFIIFNLSNGRNAVKKIIIN